MGSGGELLGFKSYPSTARGPTLLIYKMREITVLNYLIGVNALIWGSTFIGAEHVGKNISYCYHYECFLLQ